MAKANTTTGAAPAHPVQFVALKDLAFDLRNPRYGAKAGELPDEKAALNHIVATFGVQDVLSSLAVNGYFGTEPLVGLREAAGEKIKIVEGNRRLAACLILTGDDRAKDQKTLQDRFSALHKEKGSPPVAPVPVGATGVANTVTVVGEAFQF